MPVYGPQRVIDTENAVYHPDECLKTQKISGNLIAYSWLCVALLIVVTSPKNGDKNTALARHQLAHSAPCNGNVTNSLVPATFQSASNPFLAKAWPKCLPPSAHTRSHGIHSVLLVVIIRYSHGMATLLMAVPVAYGATSQAGELIVLSEAPALMQVFSPK